MSKKDLFRIVFRVLGIYFLITQLFSFLPAIIPFFTFGHTNLWSILITVFLLLGFAVFFLLLIFNPDILIRALKLDKGFDDEHIRIGTSDFRGVLKIAIIVIGMTILVKQVPIFITHLLFLFKLLVSNQHDIHSHMQNAVLTDYVSWGIKIISLIIGFLMITNYKRITDYILKNGEHKFTEK